MAPSAAAGDGGDKAEAPKFRRDLLLKIQKSAQTEWEQQKVFEVDAPQEGEVFDGGKWSGNFPYPYMNGVLHLGHAFSLSKLEFACAYQRLQGKRVLFPQGFHCTGMPIKACADKLKREIETYGNPPNFGSDDGSPLYAAAKAAVAAADRSSVSSVAPIPEDAPANAGSPDAPVGTDAKVASAPGMVKYSSKKSKSVSKGGGAATQWGILQMSGIPDEEIPQFSDPHHWLEYFPPLAVRDMKLMGCGVDWRRSFITTDANPYYDAFIAWQFNTLKKQGKVVKDKRYAVFSPLDGQPCADHDRASGEGVGPQEYTLIKMEVAELQGELKQLEGKGRLFLLAATLRPETMYGQTNCWVLPDGQYSIIQGLNNEMYLLSDRAALNMAYQELLPEPAKPQVLLTVTGQSLIGLPVKSPRCTYDVIYALPLLTILMNKGTGVVTSVPSDAPDDYRALLDLIEKPKLREKYGVKDEWVLPFEIVPIINIPQYGDLSAKYACDQLKIKSQNDKDKLAEAKNMTYLKGFTDGVMLVGEYKGQKVQDAKPQIRADMLANGEAIAYSEPESVVISRSGDECVVALTDQWYIIYGEEEWKKKTEQCLEQLNSFGDETRNAFKFTLGWLQQWACSRAFGLGTRLPWDPDYLIESLSDSTIYMAYYTVAHIIQRGDMYGRDGSGIKAQDMTDEVWDYIFLDGPLPASNPIPQSTLSQMRNEFKYWYPFDLRTSGKELINNHLSFCLYNHTAMWGPEYWPKGVRCNGHVLVNSQKMSKSKGNFKTLNELVYSTSADALRLALADAGDGFDDANYEETTADSGILRLTKELAFVEEVLADSALVCREEADWTFHDKSFNNMINMCVVAAGNAYESLRFRDALKAGMYDIQKARDVYRLACGASGMSKNLLERYIHVSTLLLTPICPHTCHHIWKNLLKKDTQIVTEKWPVSGSIDHILAAQQRYLDDFIDTVRKGKAKAEAPPKKAPKNAPPPPKVRHLHVSVGTTFESWQAGVLTTLQTCYDDSTNAFSADALNVVFKNAVDSGVLAGKNDKQVKQVVMPFAKFKMEDAIGGGKQVLDTKLPFSESDFLVDQQEYICRLLDVDTIAVQQADENATPAPTPGKPIVGYAAAAPDA